MVDAHSLYNAMAGLDDMTVTRVITETLQRRPELAPGVVNAAVPDLTYAPSDALGKRRATGVIKPYTSPGGAFIGCQELRAVFNADVWVTKSQMGMFSPGSEVSFAVLLSKDMKPQAFDLQPAGYIPASQKGSRGGFVDQSGGGGKGGEPAAKRVKGGSYEGGGGGGGARPDVQQVLGRFQGVVKSFNAAGGFGFILCDSLKAAGYPNDVYLHHSQIGSFQPGSPVSFTAYLNKKGQPQAMELEGI